MTSLLLWKALAGLASAPTSIIVVKWLLERLGVNAQREAKEADRREKERAADRAEMRAHRATRDAEFVAMTVEVVRLREDVLHCSEKAQALELQAVRDRGTIQRLSEEAERLKRERDDSRRLTRLSEPPRGGSR